MKQIQLITKASYEWLQVQKQSDFSNNYGGVTLSFNQLIKAGLISNTNTHTKNPWGGSIIVMPGDDPSHVKILLSKLPGRDCKNLAKRLETINKMNTSQCSGNITTYYGEF